MLILRLKILFVAMLSLAVLNACSPLAAVGAVGSTITRSLEDDAVNQPRRNHLTEAEARRNVAIANTNLGTAYLQQGQYESALNKLDRARQADPDYAPLYNVLGVLYQQLGKAEQAEKHFQKSLRLAPDDPSTLNNYGLFLCENERVDESVMAFERAAKNPFYKTPEVAVTNAGSCLKKHGDTARAEKYFRQALTIEPTIAPALLQMLEIAYDKGELLQARDYLQRYTVNAGHTPKTLWLGIRIEQELGDKDAVSSYAMLLRNRYADSREADLLKQSDIQ